MSKNITFDVTYFAAMVLCAAALSGCSVKESAHATSEAQIELKQAEITPPDGFPTEGKPTKTIETPWGPREVYDPTQIPRDAPLIFDESLNRVYEYFSRMKDCEDELELDKRERCLNRIKNFYGDLWGNNVLPKNKFIGNVRMTDPLVPTYPASAFKWKIALAGQLDEFVINSSSLFPSNIDADLVSLYLEHHEKNDGIKPLPLRSEGKSSYTAQSLESLRSNFPEFNLSDFMPKNYRPGSVVSGYEFTMLFGDNNSIHKVWNTNFSASDCRRNESFFYEITIEYESAWLREFLDGRNVATIHVCATNLAPRFIIFKLE